MSKIVRRAGVLLVVIALTASCDFLDDIFGVSDEEEESSGAYTTATITHGGFDFSANSQGYSQAYDGETIDWQPGGGTHPDFARMENIWWRPAGNGRTKDMGQVSLSSVTQIPATWDSSPTIPPLRVGHVVVAECADGYVKFRVNSVNPDGSDWPAEVEYYFSATTTFDQ